MTSVLGIHASGSLSPASCRASEAAAAVPAARLVELACQQGSGRRESAPPSPAPRLSGSPGSPTRCIVHFAGLFPGGHPCPPCLRQHTSRHPPPQPLRGRSLPKRRKNAAGRTVNASRRTPHRTPPADASGHGRASPGGGRERPTDGTDRQDDGNDGRTPGGAKGTDGTN